MKDIMKIIDDHLVSIRRDKEKRLSPENILATLFWGDEVADAAPDGDGWTKVTLHDGKEGWVKGKLATRSTHLLSLAFIDVGQGDAIYIETPGGRRILVDGGEGIHLARYMAARFNRRYSKASPLPLDAIVVTHGDADHYKGLIDLIECRSETQTPEHRLFWTLERLYHSGIVKRKGASDSPRKALGATAESTDDKLYLTELVDDLLNPGHPLDDLSDLSKDWIRALGGLKRRDGRPVEVRRLDSSKTDAFDFMGDDDVGGGNDAGEAVIVEVLGPTLQTFTAPGDVPMTGLEYLSKTDASDRKSPSASHTINGHSIILRLACGNVRILLAADANEASQASLLQRSGPAGLAAEIFKVPHHGSADFAARFLEAVQPVASIVSSGDDSERVEYIHPRATLMAALGRYSRGDSPLVLSSEVSAFFKYRGHAVPVTLKKDDPRDYTVAPDAAAFHAFEKTAYGIWHLRTNGRIVLLAAHSGRRDMHEAYALEVDEEHEVKIQKVISK